MRRHAQKGNQRFVRSQMDKGEFGKAHAGLTVCKICHAFYYQKSWHHSAEKFLEKGGERHGVSFKICPACTMIKNGLYEGIITIKDVPQKHKAEILGLAKNFCLHAEEKDPLDRLIAIKNGRNTLTITTTENQLAHKLAKHIIKSFKGARALTLYGKGDNVTTRVEITFPKTA